MQALVHLFRLIVSLTALLSTGACATKPSLHTKHVTPLTLAYSFLRAHLGTILHLVYGEINLRHLLLLPYCSDRIVDILLLFMAATLHLGRLCTVWRLRCDCWCGNLGLVVACSSSRCRMLCLELACGRFDDVAEEEQGGSSTSPLDDDLPTAKRRVDSFSLSDLVSWRRETLLGQKVTASSEHAIRGISQYQDRGVVASR